MQQMIWVCDDSNGDIVDNRDDTVVHGGSEVLRLVSWWAWELL